MPSRRKCGASVSDLRTPWIAAHGSGHVYPVRDATGDEVCRCYNEEDAAEIVRLVNAAAVNREVGRAILSQWTTPTAEAVIEALAQGRDDRRRVMGVKVPDRYGIPVQGPLPPLYVIQRTVSGEWVDVADGWTPEEAWSKAPIDRPCRMVRR
jgi:hypothetical protein